MKLAPRVSLWENTWVIQGLKRLSIKKATIKVILSESEESAILQQKPQDDISRLSYFSIPHFPLRRHPELVSGSASTGKLGLTHVPGQAQNDGNEQEQNIIYE